MTRVEGPNQALQQTGAARRLLWVHVPQRPRLLSLVVGQTNMETATPPRLNCDRIRHGFRHSAWKTTSPPHSRSPMRFPTRRSGHSDGRSDLRTRRSPVPRRALPNDRRAFPWLLAPPGTRPLSPPGQQRGRLARPALIGGGTGTAYALLSGSSLYAKPQGASVGRHRSRSIRSDFGRSHRSARQPFDDSVDPTEAQQQDPGIGTSRPAKPR